MKTIEEISPPFYKAAKRFFSQGLDREELAKRLADTLTLTRLSGLSFEDAALSIIASINSFSKNSVKFT